MSVFRIPAKLMLSHPVLLMGGRPFCLFMAGLCHCSANWTDGHIACDDVKKLRWFTPRAAAKLVQVGGWTETAHGIHCPWFLVWNPGHTREKFNRMGERVDRMFSTDPRLKKRLVAKWGDVCVYCGAPGPGLHIEHIIPLCRGGADAWDNLTLACQRCNYTKGRKTAAEFGHPRFEGKRNDGPRTRARLPVLPQGLFDGWERRGHVAPGKGRLHLPALPVLAGAELARRHWPLS